MDRRNLYDIIEAINAELEAGEPDNVSWNEFEARAGYEGQYVIDAVNRHLGPENWRIRRVSEWTIHQKVDKASGEMVPGSVEAEFELDIRLPEGEWLSKGPVVGANQIGTNLAEAKNAATRNATKKLFSLWSIGNRAYLGLLTLEHAPEKAARKAKPSETPRPARGTDKYPNDRWQALGYFEDFAVKRAAGYLVQLAESKGYSEEHVARQLQKRFNKGLGGNLTMEEVEEMIALYEKAEPKRS
ncbi:MAG TPA: hypothetical protein EYP85_01225 [Armatimonadetes bacterium]|nr:hypothetical protein [Armatimonadota bacterium]